jgi:beta-aspartyl-peptidase (threonine type)
VRPAQLISFSLSLLLPSACGAAARNYSESDSAAIRNLLDQQAKAWNRGDLVAFMDGYVRGPDLIFTSGARIQRGYEETLVRYQKRYGSDASTMGKLSFEVLYLRGIGGDAALLIGRYQLTDAPAKSSGIFTLVFERRPEGWKIVHDHTTAEPQPAPASSGTARASPPHSRFGASNRNGRLTRCFSPGSVPSPE